jgi:hypothetical protein
MKKILLPISALLLGLLSAPTWADGNATLAPGQWHCEPSPQILGVPKNDKSTPFDFEIFLVDGEGKIVVKQDGATYYYEGDTPYDGGGTIGMYYKVKGNAKGGVFGLDRLPLSAQFNTEHVAQITRWEGGKFVFVRVGKCKKVS